MLSTSLLLAAVLTFLVGAVHSWLGERKLIGPLLALEVASATFLVTGVIVLVTSRGRHLAWPVFLIIAVAAALPAWR